MNDPIITARVLLCLLAVIPSVVGYYWAQYYDYFPRHSLKQIGLLLLTLFLIFGSTVLQWHVYLVVGHIAKGDMFTNILFIVQFLFALIIFFVSMTKHERIKRSVGENKRSISKHD